MKAMVNKDTCTGCGICVDICPEVFEIGDEIANAKVAVVPAQAEVSCKEAMEGCPVSAISITQ